MIFKELSLLSPNSVRSALELPNLHLPDSSHVCLSRSRTRIGSRSARSTVHSIEQLPYYIARDVQKLLSADGVSIYVSTLRERVSPSSLYLVGGALRDVAIRLLYRRVMPLDDLDFAVPNLSAPLDSYLGSLEDVRRNSFTGLTWKPKESSLSFGVWPLEQTISLCKSGLNPTLANFIRNLDFNVNAIVYDVESRKLSCSKSFLDGLAQRTIDFQTNFISIDYITAARAVILAQKTGFTLSPRLIGFIRSLASKEKSRREILNYFDYYTSKGATDPRPSSSHYSVKLIEFCSEN